MIKIEDEQSSTDILMHINKIDTSGNRFIVSGFFKTIFPSAFQQVMFSQRMYLQTANTLKVLFKINVFTYSVND